MKIILAIISMIVCFSGYSQRTSIDNFMGNDYQKYKGAYFNLWPEAGVESFRGVFYQDSSSAQTRNIYNVIYPEKEQSPYSIKDSLKNRAFLVTDIIASNELPFDKRPIFILIDTTNKQKIYFIYNPDYESFFPFITTTVTIPNPATSDLKDDDISSNIDRYYDEFTHTLHLSSPILEPVCFSKEIRYGRAVTYLRLETTGILLYVKEKGAIVLFTDGSKWNKPNIDINVDVKRYKKSEYEDDWEYSAFIQLTAADVNLFATKKISKFRLYIFDEVLDEIQAEKFRLFVQAINKMKR